MRPRWLRPTIRVRLTIWYGGMFLLAGAALIVLMYVLVEQALSGRRWVGGRVLTSPHGAPPAVDPATDQRLKTALSAAQQALEQEVLDQLLTQGAVALALLGVIAVGFGWLMADRVLRPLHRITDTARRVAGSNLHERIGMVGPRDELKELADTFDAMLERLDRAFAGQRKFVANASHELQTPLAINRTLLEVAMSRPDASGDLRQVGGTLLAVNARHERLIDGLLTLARTEHELTERLPVDLGRIVRHLQDLNRTEAEQAGVTVSAEPAPATAVGDPVLLDRLVQNLVQNGIRHNHPGGWVTVATRDTGAGAELTVANTGPAVPEWEVDGLFEPFRRLSTQERVHSDRGVGLGLSIVRAVALAHGGQVDAEPREGGGLVVRVLLLHPGPAA